MGKGFKLYCTNCVKIEQNKYYDTTFWDELGKIKPSPIFNIFEGSGWTQYDKETFCNELAGDELIDDKILKDEILNKLNNGYEISENYCFSTYYCQRCQTIESYFSFLLYKNKIKYIPRYEYKYCNSILQKFKFVLASVRNKVNFFINLKKTNN